MHNEIENVAGIFFFQFTNLIFHYCKHLICIFKVWTNYHTICFEAKRIQNCIQCDWKDEFTLKSFFFVFDRYINCYVIAWNSNRTLLSGCFDFRFKNKLLTFHFFWEFVWETPMEWFNSRNEQELNEFSHWHFPKWI